MADAPTTPRAEPDHASLARPPRRRLRRHLIIALGCLLAGAIINVLLAWGFARFDSVDFMYTRQVTGTGSTGAANAAPIPAAVRRFHNDALPEGFAHRMEVWRSGSSYGLTTIELYEISPDEMQAAARIRSAGWPWRSMSSIELLHRDMRSGQPWIEQWSTGFQLSNEQWYLPCRPAWPGFIGNTLLFALILWLPFVRPILRSARRRRKGQCPACGYDLRGADHDVCPECGAEVARRRADNHKAATRHS